MSPGPDQPPLAHPGSEPAIREHPMGVLLVDDQAIIGEAVRRMLAADPEIRFRFCQDPTRALEEARAFEPTVILSDLVMPQMDGLELVRRFRADEATRRIPLIVLSSREEATTKAEAFALGVNDYLVKLPDRIELLARIRHHSEGYVSRLERDEAFEALARSQRLLAEDVEQAARYVRSILPEPMVDRVRASWRFVPSASLGGDAFGYHWLDEEHFVAYLLDVSGHGVGAALLSVSVLNLLRARSLLRTDFRDPGQVLTRLNDTFRMEDHQWKFFTIWYGVWRPADRTLAYAGAGHPPALLFSGKGEAPAALASEGPMVGALPGVAWERRVREVPPASRLLLYSDGVYEVRRDPAQPHEYEAFLDEMARPASGGRGPLERAMAHALRQRPGPAFADDVSLVEIDLG